MDFDISEIGKYLTAGNSALDIFKGIRAELPKGPKADEIQQQIEKAEAALRASEASAAKALGYNLCQCTFPPQIMLWRERESAYVCPNESCGKRIVKRTGAPRVITRPPGPGDWMR